MTLDVSVPVPRRIVLTGLIAATAVPALSGCGIRLEGADSPAVPDTDEKARRAVVRRLRAADDVAHRMNAGHDFSNELDRVRSMLAVQLAALGARPGRAATAQPTRAVKSPTPRALMTHVAAVRDSSLRRLDRVSGVFARRLAGVAAGSAGAAHVVGAAADLHVPSAARPLPPPEETAKPPSPSPSPVSTPSSGAATALEALGDGLYAAIYGYEVLTVRLTGDARRRAAGRLDKLRTTVGEVNTQLRGGGAEPARPRAGYSLPYSVEDAKSALKLAATLERRLGMHLGKAVTDLPAGTRYDAAHWLFESTLAGWRLAKTLPAVPGSTLPRKVRRAGSAPSGSTDTKHPNSENGA